jgi:hypothetical protein
MFAGLVECHGGPHDKKTGNQFRNKPREFDTFQKAAQTSLHTKKKEEESMSNRQGLVEFNSDTYVPEYKLDCIRLQSSGSDAVLYLR